MVFDKNRYLNVKTLVIHRQGAPTRPVYFHTRQNLLRDLYRRIVWLDISEHVGILFRNQLAPRSRIGNIRRYYGWHLGTVLQPLHHLCAY